tara:strand:+ start:1617 stop:2903 length:1287 start_codon:yes stop_codon:yes gene_type:complete
VFSFYRIVVLALAISVLSACGSPQSGEPVFKKAEGYTCKGSVIKNEYLVRLKNGDLKVIHAKSEDEFLSGYFEKHKDQIQTAEPHYSIHTSDFLIPTSANTLKKKVKEDLRFNNWGSIQIHADKYWSQNVYGQGIIVAVIDTGVDLDHFQLASQILENEGETGLDENGKDKRFNNIDDDKNGYVDDWKGFDFYFDRGLTGDNGAEGHGTHVAGIIAAKHSEAVATENSKVLGIAPGVKILPASFLGPEGGGSIEDGIRAIRYGVERGAKIINASWGSNGCSLSLRDEVRSLADKNVIFVSAAGNSSSNLDTWPEYPASFEGLTQLTVGSIDQSLNMSTFSNYSARFVNIFAPGSEISSTLPKSAVAEGEAPYGTYSGTSMATPFVSGAAALLWAANPEASAFDIKAQLLSKVAKSQSYENQTQGRLEL